MATLSARNDDLSQLSISYGIDRENCCTFTYPCESNVPRVRQWIGNYKSESDILKFKKECSKKSDETVVLSETSRNEVCMSYYLTRTLLLATTLNFTWCSPLHTLVEDSVFQPSILFLEIFRTWPRYLCKLGRKVGRQLCNGDLKWCSLM